MGLQRATLPLLLGALLIVGGLLLPAYAAPAAAPAAVVDSRFERMTLVFTGTDGEVSGVVTSGGRLMGYINAIYVDYTAGISGTTDITISTVSPVATVLLLTDTVTDGWWYPSVQLSGVTSATVAAYEKFPVNDQVKVQVGSTASGTVAAVTVFYGE